MSKYQEVNPIRRKFNVFLEWIKRGFDLNFFLYRFRWNYVAKYDAVLKFPIHLDIETTEACNLKCIMCVHGTTGVPITGLIDTKFAKNLIDQAAEGGTKSIKFNWRGEPALHKGLEDLIEYAKLKGILEVQINTNGIPFNEKRIKKIINSGLDRVIFSMDGATKKTYERIRIGSNFNKLMSNIKTFYEIRKSLKRQKPFIRIQMVKMKDNQNEVNKFISMWKNIADDIRVNDVTNRGQGSMLYSGDQVAIGRKRCNQPWQRMIIARDGEVFPCCADWDRNYKIGDSKKTSLKDIWKGKRMNDLREINRKKELDKHHLCKNCYVETSYEWRKMTKEEIKKRDLMIKKSDKKNESVIRIEEAFSD